MLRAFRGGHTLRRSNVCGPLSSVAQTCFIRMYLHSKSPMVKSMQAASVGQMLTAFGEGGTSNRHGRQNKKDGSVMAQNSK